MLYFHRESRVSRYQGMIIYIHVGKLGKVAPSSELVYIDSELVYIAETWMAFY